MTATALLAKAAYDNIADAPDELTFRKGDIITVLEKDVDGLDGWWLCSLHGRNGIAPGNRLKEIANLSQISTPASVGHEQDYAIPRSHESETGEDYDVPRSVVSPTSPGADYDIPKSDLDDFYDLPKSVFICSQEISQETCDKPSPWSSHRIPEKKHGSLEKENDPVQNLVEDSASTSTQEIYDIPCGSQVDKVPSRQNSTEGAGELYDVPVSPKEKREMSKEMFSALHDVWVKKENQKNGNSNKLDLNHNKNVQQKLARKKSGPGVHPGDQKGDGKVEKNRESSGSVDSGRSSAEDDDYVDYHEIYGLGRGEQRPENVYDIPVQGKDSAHPIPVKKTTTSILQRINMSAVKGIKLDSQSALQRLTKLQQVVDAGVTKLLSYVKTDWRNPETLRQQIADIRDITGKVKVALRLLTEFGLSTLINAQQLPTPEMSGRMSRAIEPLLETYYSMKLALQRLDDQNWKAPLDRSDSTHDDLDLIMVYIRSVPENSVKLGTVVRYGAPVLFGPAKVKGTGAQTTMNSSSLASASQTPQDAGETRASPSAVRREEVRAKIEKFEVSTMKADSQPLDTSSHLAGEVKIGSNQGSVPESDGERLSPTTVRRLCDLDPPKLPRKDSSSEFASNPPGVGSLPPWPPVRQDSGEKIVWRMDSADKMSKGAPPPKPRLDRQPTVRKRYDLNRKQSQMESIDEKKEDSSNEGAAKSNSQNVLKKCNSDPMKFGEAKKDGGSQSLPQRTSNSFDDSSVVDRELPTKNIMVHISDSDLPQGSKSPTVKPKPFGTKRDNTSMRSLEMDNGFLLSLSDKELLEFYKYEIDAQLFVLNEAMKNFYSCLEEKQPPNVFVSSSKFVVLSAHKFVFIGDTLQKKLKHSTVMAEIKEVTNKLSAAAKLLVNATKVAALQFPAVSPMKEMSAAVANVLDTAVELHKVVKRTPNH